MEVIYPKKIDNSESVTQLQTISDVLKAINTTSKLIENHSALLVGEYTWNGYTSNLYLLAGGVPASFNLQQYMNDICALPDTGSVFVVNDSLTGLRDIFLYPFDYIQKLMDYNSILNIGGDKFVFVTVCDIEFNDNELGSQLADDLATDVVTGGVIDQDIEYPFVYNGYLLNEKEALISSSPKFNLPTYENINDLISKYTKEEVEASGIIGLGHQFNSANNQVDLTGHKYWTSEVLNDDRYFFNVDTWSLSKWSDMGCQIILTAPADGIEDGKLWQNAYRGANGIYYDAITLNGFWWTEPLRENKFLDGFSMNRANVIQDYINAKAGIPIYGTYPINESLTIDDYGAIASVSEQGLVVSNIDGNRNLRANSIYDRSNNKRGVGMVLLRKIN